MRLLLDCKLTINREKNGITICWHEVTVKFFNNDVFLLLLVQVSCQYHDWFWAGSIFVYNKSTRNLEIENAPIWVLPNIWRLGEVRDAKFSKNVCYKKLLKTQGYSFYHFRVIKGNTTGGKIIPPSPRLGLINMHI